MNYLKIICQTLNDKKAEDIIVLDFQNQNPLADYFVICHANSERQMQALIDGVIEKLDKNRIRSVEGNENSGWLLIDAYDIIVHIFIKQAREFYNLENLWLDVKRVNCDEIL